jgi:hypothetical protein
MKTKPGQKNIQQGPKSRVVPVVQERVPFDFKEPSPDDKVLRAQGSSSKVRLETLSSKHSAVQHAQTKGIDSKTVPSPADNHLMNGAMNKLVVGVKEDPTDRMFR